MTSNDAVFEPKTPTGLRIRCRTCGVAGYDVDQWTGTTRQEYPSWWGWAHIDGHPYPCPFCGRRFTTLRGVRGHRGRAHPHQMQEEST